MRISKVKIWLQVNKEIIEPIIKSREIILNSSNEKQLERAIKIMESVAENLSAMMSYVEYRMELEKVGVQKILRYTKENHIEHSKELMGMKITEEMSASLNVECDNYVQYFNYIIDQAAPAVELYHHYA